VLRIDLLPKTIAQARTNRLLLVASLVALALCALYWLHTSSAIQAQIAATEKRIEEVKPVAAEVDKLTAELNKKQADLKPIADKVDFVAEADKCGEIYWDQYHKIKRYIYGRAQMLNFSITPPNGVSFTVVLHGTTEYARFLLNLLRCPYMTLTGFQALSAGRQIPSAEEPEAGEWPTARGKIAAPGAAGATQRPTTPGGVPGMGPAMQPPMGMGGTVVPAMAAPEPMPGGAMMMPSPQGPGAGGAAGGATSAPEQQEITLQVSGTLLTTITVPTPRGGAPAGMPGGEMGMGMPPGMAGPGMPGPGMGPAGPGPAPGGPAAGPAPAEEPSPRGGRIGRRGGGGGEE
jgi:hypothetical protein